jgi:hypothetical protein
MRASRRSGNDMGIANDVKNLSADIIASYDARIKTIGTIVKETQTLAKNTHAMLNGFDSEHKKMSTAQAADLNGFMAGLTKNAGNIIKGFQEEHKNMTAALNSSLRKSTKDMQTYVRNELLEFPDSHEEMSAELKKDLAKYAADIVNGTQDLLGSFHDEREAMSDHWNAMAAVMAGKRGSEPINVKAKSEAQTVEEAFEKPAAGKAGKSKINARGKKK